MKKSVHLSMVLFIFAVPFLTNAHSGGTDSNGGHTCRTNCPSYGLSYGEYHRHGGTSNYKASSYKEPPFPTWVLILGGIVWFIVLPIYWEEKRKKEYDQSWSRRNAADKLKSEKEKE